MRNPIRLAARQARRLAWGIRPIDDDPYGTHLPVLTALAAVIPVRRVAEFGAGSFSTPHFLDRAAFPDLEELVSFEDNEAWGEQVSSQVGDDSRFDLRMVPSVPQSVPEDLSNFDLVFIDDSPSAEKREHTVRAVAGAQPGGVVVVHDFQLWPLRRTARHFENVLIVKTFTPQVGLMWNESRVSRSVMRRAASMVDLGADLPVTDSAAWRSLFQSSN